MWREVFPAADAEVEGSWSWLARQTGLTGVLDFDFGKIDHFLVGTFVERWQPETNNFHFPFGEITITLHDVALIIGLPIEGDEVVDTEYSLDHGAEFFEHMFWNDPEYELATQSVWARNYKKKGEIHAKGFREHLLYLIEAGVLNEEVAMGFLFHVLSLSLFMNRTTHSIWTRFLPLFDGVDRVRGMAWGTGVLAYMYRALGEATRSGVKGIGGCCYLLQVNMKNFR